LEAKYDVISNIEEEKCLDWIEDLIGEEVDDLYTNLKSGRVLCRLMNRIWPNTVFKINEGTRPMQERVC
jgi:hypothetical protein